ncbi:MAG: DUF1987 domain-containing protein [Ekhidna sp.]|nr:DUF1987 domain-containing protein [Ekhidna sp.]MBC6409708.1 DUF1987 domain-containing protein [Ekhidna sp.]
MEKVFIEPTRTTPMIKFDPDEGLLEMKGRSSPENSIRFYKKILDSLDEYSKFGGEELTTNIAFEYFNTSSSKCLFDVFKRIRKIENSGRKITINWFYEEGDDDMIEAGEDYSNLLDLDFNFKEIEEDDL